MNELWKGIAIAGIWLSIAAMIICIIIFAKNIPDRSTVDFSSVFILAFILSWIIAAK